MATDQPHQPSRLQKQVIGLEQKAVTLEIQKQNAKNRADSNKAKLASATARASKAQKGKQGLQKQVADLKEEKRQLKTQLEIKDAENKVLSKKLREETKKLKAQKTGGKMAQTAEVPKQLGAKCNIKEEGNVIKQEDDIEEQISPVVEYERAMKERARRQCDRLEKENLALKNKAEALKIELLSTREKVAESGTACEVCDAFKDVDLLKHCGWLAEAAEAEENAHKLERQLQGALK